MKARMVAAAVATCALVLAVAGTVSAGGATRTTIWINNNDTLGTATFWTSGGALCPTGTASNFFQMFGGSGNSRAGSFHGYKVLTCDDNSGTFSITYDASTVFGSPTDQGGWHLFNGTGNYAGYSGGGNLVGTYYSDGIVDQYTGSVSAN